MGVQGTGKSSANLLDECTAVLLLFHIEPKGE